MTNANEAWPDLPYAAWRDTSATLHLWTQIVGKIRLVQTPWLNHSWHCTLYVTPRGLTTSSIPSGDRTFELTFDFIRHVLIVTSDDGETREIGLRPRTVADFNNLMLPSQHLAYRTTDGAGITNNNYFHTALL